MTCARCGAEFIAQLVRTRPRRFCSRACSNRNASDRARERLLQRDPTTLKMIERNGYLMRRINRTKKFSYQYEHRLVMEAHVGRPLTSDEIVHHVNGDKHDNRLENLRITTRADHAREHIAEGTWGIGISSERRKAIEEQALLTAACN